MDCSPRQRRFSFRAAARTGLICASMSPPCSTASARASIASPSSCFGFTNWTKRNSSAAPVERFLSQGKEEIPGTFCLPAIFLNSSDWISLKAAHPPPHCLQLAQVRTRVRRKCEGASSLSVPRGDSGRDKPSVDVFSMFSLLLFACSEQLAQERSGRNNNGPMDPVVCESAPVLQEPLRLFARSIGWTKVRQSSARADQSLSVFFSRVYGLNHVAVLRLPGQ